MMSEEQVTWNKSRRFFFNQPFFRSFVFQFAEKCDISLVLVSYRTQSYLSQELGFIMSSQDEMVHSPNYLRKILLSHT